MPRLKSKEVREKIIFRVEARVFLLIFFLVVFFVGQYFLRQGIIGSNPAAYNVALSEGEKADSNSSSEEYSSEEIGMPGSASISKKDFYLGSFGYSFSNIDETKTNLYFDKTATAIFFPPDYEWRDAIAEASDKEDFKAIKFNDFKGPYNDERCLNDNCLEQRGNKLYYNGRVLAHPSSVRNLDIEALSIGALQNRWLVGYTIKKKDGYEAQAFYFKGGKFTKILFPEPLSSPYFGLFGFGGIEDDFLIIYGAYQGTAYRVRGERVIKLDKLFGLRVMDKGFKPEVIRAVRDSDVSWYIYSQSLNHPQLIKLWQNGGEEIVGEQTFPDLFFGHKSAGFRLRAVFPDRVVLGAELTDSKDNKSFKTFTDKGFKNTSEGNLVTRPISHDGGKSEIIIKKIARARLEINEADRSLVKFLFSSNGVDWRNIPLGENSDFTTSKIKSYFLGLIFPPSQDRFYSPFVSGISFDYYCQK